MAKLKIISHSSPNQLIDLEDSKEYFLGRDKSNDIVIGDAKVSRKHAKLCYKNEAWYIEKLSQVGKISVNSNEMEGCELVHGDDIQIGTYNFLFLQEPHEEYTPEVTQISDQNIEEASFFQAIDETTAGTPPSLEAYLRIAYTNSSEELLKLEGSHWVIGRSDECDVQLKDGRASRKHIVISMKGPIYCVRDLGSSNFSYLNGKKISTDKDLSLESGASIELGSTKIRFEIRNSIFDDQINKLPMKSNAYPAIIGANGDSHPTERGGQIVQIKDRNAMGFIIPDSSHPNGKAKKKKLVIYAAISLCAIIIAASMSQEQVADTNTGSKTMASSDPYETLSQQQKQYISNSYNLSYQFYTQGQYDLAIAEAEKIHKLLPEGYIDKDLPDRNSKVLAQHAEDGLKIEQERARIAEIRAQREAFNKKMSAIVESCRRKISFLSSKQMETCLDLVLSNKPGDSESMELIQTVKNREVETQRNQERRIAINAKIESGEDLFEKASRLEKNKDLTGAIDAYEAHIQSSYPDPNNLKNISRKKISDLNLIIKDYIDKNLMKAQNLFELEKYKECIELLDEILKLSPKNSLASEKYGMAKNQLHQKLQKDYQDSIFREAHGEVEEARKIWKDILKADVKGGEYYNKAEIKLKQQGY